MSKPNLRKSIYTRSRSTYSQRFKTVVEEYELQYNKNHIVEKVKVGELDLVKEVASHIGEVGLQNVIALAIAHGEDPLTKFAKVDPGVPVAIDPNITKDGLEDIISSNSSKKVEVATALGITVDQFEDALEKGTLSKLIEDTVVPKVDLTKDGE